VSHYLISEASRIVDEESHVLRYWEEELALKIPRNDLGHRYYTEVQLDLFRTIKRLKQQGYQLKEIRQCLEEMEKKKRENIPDEFKEIEMDPEPEGIIPGPDEILLPDGIPVPVIPPTEEMCSKQPASPTESPKMQEFKRLMAEIFLEVMNAGYTKMTDEITEQVSRKVIKEINYLDREREEWEEEQFRRLDATIRNCQRRGKFRAEVAAAEQPDKHKRWRLGTR